MIDQGEGIPDHRQVVAGLLLGVRPQVSTERHKTDLDTAPARAQKPILDRLRKPDGGAVADRPDPTAPAQSGPASQVAEALLTGRFSLAPGLVPPEPAAATVASSEVIAASSVADSSTVAGTQVMRSVGSTQRRPVAGKRRWAGLAVVAVIVLLALGTAAFLVLRPRDKGADYEAQHPGDGSVAIQQPEQLPKSFTNSLGMEFVLVPKGKSWLGGGGGRLHGHRGRLADAQRHAGMRADLNPDRETLRQPHPVDGLTDGRKQSRRIR